MPHYDEDREENIDRDFRDQKEQEYIEDLLIPDPPAPQKASDAKTDG